MKKQPDILNSKIKKIRIELPHYSFSHSSSGDSHHAFIGRERIRERLKKVIEDSPDEPGVYLIAGNRGVGKTSLVSWVINETSLKTKTGFTENFRYIILLFLAVAGTHVLTQFCSNKFNIQETNLNIAFGLIFALFFILLCCFNSYRRKKHGILGKIWNCITSAFKELGCLINQYNPYGKSQYLLKIILVVSFTQLVSVIHWIITPTIALFGYLIIVLGYNIFFRLKRKKIHKNKKEKLSKENTSILLKLKNMFLIPIWKYIKNHNRLYLRINFGHKLKDEKDILRLITRTLITEYEKYRHLIWRMLPWRIIALGFLLLFAFSFSSIVEKQEFYKKLIKDKDLYNASSQILLEYHTLKKDKERLDGAFFTEDILVTTKVKVKTTRKSAGQTFSKEKTQNPGFFTEIDKVGSNFFLSIDQIIYEMTKIVKKSPQFFLCRHERSASEIKFVPPINYLFWLTFLLTYLFFILLFRCTWITPFFITHRIIIRRLKTLNNDITHSTERENSINMNSGNIGIGTKTKKSRNVADAREIEKELQDILSDMRRIPVIMCRPNIVIVFDELDKVEPGDTDSEKENQQTKASLFSIGATRERQTEILRILSNMKYFLSTASVKFIFIAGREMLDFHLADVSERNNYIGSIFNVVIPVPSFLTDHHTGTKKLPQESSIASLPEEFVCRRLIPHDYPVESYNLENYRVYLERKIFCKYTQKEEIQKVIAILQQFIIYLAHVSKGAPKKMIQLFESHIDIRTDRDDTKNTLLVQRYHGSRHFLSFNYYKQYTIGIVAYLITPIFYRLAESNIKEHSDKLLVSSLRFVDFLFKFHKHSFSWKHLDMSPEMLEVNRAPELKSVAVELLNYLAQVHINKSNFSLSEYKFDGLIANEIFAMAKTDEVFSALFSFSLDEMLPLKKHYQDLLERTQKEYQNEYKNKYKKKSPVFIDAISSLQGVLGDLHYYDDELEEAESYYKSAVQALREKKEEMTIEQLYVYVRNMLRLGIIYEKRKQYDFAYLTYGELCARIIRERDIEFNKFNVGVELRKDKDNNDKLVFVKASTTRCLCDAERKYHENIDVYPISASEDKVYDSLATLQPLYFKTISPKINGMLFKKMTYEGLKMLYLPFIAKLQILEQSHIGGITRNHLVQLDKEFKFLTFIINHEEAKLLEAEFYSRVADVLYYKNSDLKYKNGKNRINDNDEDEQNCENKDTTSGNSDDVDISPKNSSCTACYYYHKALSILLGKPYFYNYQDKSKNTVRELLLSSIKQLKENYNVKFCTILARILSDWGNVFFSCDTKDNKNGCGCYILDNIDCNTKQINYYCACYDCDTIKCNPQQICYRCACYNCDKMKCNTRKMCYHSTSYICDVDNCKEKYSEGILKKYIDYVEFESINENGDAILEIFSEGSYFKKMETAFAMYSISSVAYRKASLYKRSSYQIYKMLCLFKDYNIYNDSYIKILSKRAIHYLWYANDDLNVLDLNKRKKDFDKDTIDEVISLKNLLVDTEITRIRILVKDMELKSDLTTKKLNEFYDLRITSPYRINYSIVARVYRLRLKTKINYEAYQQLLEKVKIPKEIRRKKEFILEEKYYDEMLINEGCKKVAREIFEKSINTNEIFENLIADSIYCLIDIVQLVETMDETYLFPHSFIGSVHEHLSFWIRQYEKYKMYKDKDSKIDKYLKQYLDEEWREPLSGYRENQRALSHYYKCLEMHSGGRAYQNMLDIMVYLRDDFNDRSDHFNIAEERHLIVNGKIEKKIKAIKDIYKDSRLYEADNYYKELQ